MSICPTDDIHSLYLDKEMPEIYKAEYEAHLAQCETCQKKLKKMQMLHDLFNDDSQQITPNKEFLDKSFERLQLKMRYSSNITSKKKMESAYRTKYLIPSVAAVAAAFLIAVVLPTNLKSSLNTGSNQVVASNNIVSRIPSATDVSLGGGRSVVISGNIHESILPSSGNDVVPMGIDVAAKNASAVVPVAANDHLIKNYEVFSPDIGNEEKISIRITVPGVNTTPVFTEIELPLNVIMGQN